MTHWRQLAGSIRTEIGVYQRVLKHPCTPASARCLLGLALLYLFSPFDLIPDWLPVIGQLDDLLIVPFLVHMALKRIPPAIIHECRAAAGSSYS